MHSWHHSLHKAKEKKIYRSVILAKTNDDYRMKYPSEAKDCIKTTFKQPHPEAIKRIEHDHDLMCQLRLVPAVERPHRWSRNAK